MVYREDEVINKEQEKTKIVLIALGVILIIAILLFNFLILPKESVEAPIRKSSIQEHSFSTGIGINKWVYEGFSDYNNTIDYSKQIMPKISNGKEFSKEKYEQLTNLNDNIFATTETSEDGKHAFQIFKFSSGDLRNLTSVKISWRGIGKGANFQCLDVQNNQCVREGFTTVAGTNIHLWRGKFWTYVGGTFIGGPPKEEVYHEFSKEVREEEGYIYGYLDSENNIYVMTITNFPANSAENIKSVLKTDYLSIEVNKEIIIANTMENLTSEFISKPNITLSFYKGIIINLHPGVYPNYLLSSIIADAKNLNTNIVDIWIETNPKYMQGIADVKSNFEYQKLRRAKLIELAHKNGLQVSLRLACLAKNETSGVLPLSEFLACVREEAKIAQELDVYQIILFGEIDAVFDEKEAQLYAIEALKEVRKYYNGRVGIGFCCAVYEYSYNLSGYDFLLRSVYAPPKKNLDNWIFNVSSDQINLFDNINAVRQLANKSGVKEVIVGETGVCDPSKKDPEGRDECFYMNTTHVTAQEETKYYEKFFERSHDLVQGYFIFYIFPVMSVKDEPAKQVVKEWYGK